MRFNYSTNNPFKWLLLLLTIFIGSVLHHSASAQKVSLGLSASAALNFNLGGSCGLQVALSSNVPSCDGNTVCLTILGGIAPYKILVDGQSHSSSLLGLAVCIQNLRPGNHVVKVIDSQGCDAVLTVNILSIQDLLKPVVKHATCYGSLDGAISLDLSLLIGIDISNLVCKWEGPDGYHGEGRAIRGLKAGKYFVRIVTILGVCIGTGSWEVEQAEPIKIDIAISNPSCSAANVCAFIKGGKAPYRIWGFTPISADITQDNFLNFIHPENHNPTNSTLYDPNTNPFCVNELSAGSYYILVQDANGCYAWKIFRVNANAKFERILDVKNISCYGEQNGKICFKIRGNSPPYHTTLSATWSDQPAKIINGESGCFENLQAGEYLLTTTDGAGCTSSEHIKISAPADLEAAFILENNTCQGGASGCLKISGGTQPYQIYVWNHPNPTNENGYEIGYWDNGTPYVLGAQRSTAFNFPPVLDPTNRLCAYNIPPGDYILLVVDANNCYEKIVVHIDPVNNLQAKFEVSSGNCNELGSGCLTIEGGSGGYKVFVWGWNSPLTVIPQVRFDANGKPYIEGGQQTEWHWSTPGIAPPYQICASDIPSGYYYILVVDADGCYKLISVHIPIFNKIHLKTHVENVSCYGEKDGQIKLFVEGGEQPYTIYFNGNQEHRAQLDNLTIVFDSLKAGVYKIEVKDKNGCSAAVEVKITEPEPLVATFIQEQSESCSGTGGGCVKVNGGTHPYKLLIWNWEQPSDVIPTVHFNANTSQFEVEGDISLNVQPTPPAPNDNSWCYRHLTPGDYLVLIIDANGCQTLLPFHISEPNALQLTAVVVNPTCNTTATGTIKLYIAGGAPPYQVKVSDRSITTNDSIVVFENIPPGNYKIWVYDKFQCTEDINVVVKTPGIDANLTYDKYGAYACVNPSGGTPHYKIEWLNLETGAVISNDTCVRNLPPSVYLVTIFDQAGCSVQHWILIEPQACEGGIAKVHPESIVSGEGTKFSLSGHVGASIQWQFKTDFIEWSNIPGATRETYTTPPIHTSWDKIIKVRAQIKCADGSIVYSNETAFKIRGNHLLNPIDARLEDTQLFNPEFRKADVLALERNPSNGSTTLVYPTVARDFVKVRFVAFEQQSVKIYILNSLGTVVYQTQQDDIYKGDEIELPVRQLTSGTYFVRIESGENLTTQRIVVQ